MFISDIDPKMDRQVILTDPEGLVGKDLELSFRAVRANQLPAGVVPR